MSSANAYRRAPLVDPAFGTLADSAVHADGLPRELTEKALKWVNVEKMSSLDAILATRLGGYTDAPPMPDVESAAKSLVSHPVHFAQSVRAGMMIASMNRDKESMLRVLGALKSMLDQLPMLSEETLFLIGADILRAAVELYRRTGQRFLLDLMENLRSRLPDVSGVMHMFPFQTAYEPEEGKTAQEKEYYARMNRFATGKGTADSLAMASLLAQYSGSGREAAAAKVGLVNLTRYHGMPSGVFSADPYLAGRDPARGADLASVCAQAEALLDALLLGGDPLMAEKLESLLVNVLPDFITEKGLRTMSPTNRLADDDSCEASQTPEAEDVSALLRALYAVRRAVWLSRDDETIAYMLPVSGGCITRVGGIPMRITADVKGVFEQEITLKVECPRQDVRASILLRIPGYADGAQVSVNGGQPQQAAQGTLFEVKRAFHTGDTITLRLNLSPRMETGFRSTVSISVGARLMALALPGTDVSWRYAVLRSMPMTSVEDEGVPYALITACEAPEWREKAGFILPPPQVVPMGAAYELTLIPFAGTEGRIAAFPCVTQR